MSMTSNKPYLIRAVYDWIVDNELTPYILVNAVYDGVQVPQEHVVEARIVLNISPAATRGLLLENDRIVFTTRFGGEPRQVYLPPAAVLEIYAKENGKGIAFELEESPPPPPEGVSTEAEVKPIKKGKPSLKIVKNDLE